MICNKRETLLYRHEILQNSSWKLNVVISLDWESRTPTPLFSNFTFLNFLNFRYLNKSEKFTRYHIYVLNIKYYSVKVITIFNFCWTFYYNTIFKICSILQILVREVSILKTRPCLSSSSSTGIKFIDDYLTILFITLQNFVNQE